VSETFRKRIVYSALFLAIIWGIYNFLPKSNPPPAQQINPSPEQVSAQTAPAPKPVEKTVDVAEMKSKPWGPDPFRATGRRIIRDVGTGENKWRLSGIVYNSIKPLAIINGKSVSEGQNIGSATVVEISPKTVILEDSGAKVTLRVTKG
jgi:hypothetical protein